ncbi:hypothetical protein WISP_66286 [Willisornis vidua]|uniref:Uncharacterized protein n=1 Tax=Willisornis vidua TaxID=1566151 RepID=A0ABQ9DEL8_9PASS|nr:hypothetical protein WISP_66286 [Willisornis vidua]
MGRRSGWEAQDSHSDPDPSPVEGARPTSGHPMGRRSGWEAQDSHGDPVPSPVEGAGPTSGHPWAGGAGGKLRTAQVTLSHPLWKVLDPALATHGQEERVGSSGQPW